jgi:hypothetical protein
VHVDRFPIITPGNDSRLTMHSHALREYQCVERCYRVVTVSRNGVRTIISQHDFFLAAERARKMIPSQDGVEIRIETARGKKIANMAG